MTHIAPNKSATYNRNDSTSSSRLLKLKNGKRINIFVGPRSYPYIAIESAFVSTLCHYSAFARKKSLDNHSINSLYIPDSMRVVVQWIYSYMLAGEKDMDLDVKFENMSNPDLCDVYSHAQLLEYPALARRVYVLVRSRLTGTLPGAATIPKVYEVLPTLTRLMIWEIVEAMLMPWTIEFKVYMDLAAEHDTFAKDVTKLMHKRLCGLVDRGKRYYAKKGMSNGDAHLQNNVTTNVSKHATKDTVNNRANGTANLVNNRNNISQNDQKLHEHNDKRKTETPDSVIFEAQPKRNHRRFNRTRKQKRKASEAGEIGSIMEKSKETVNHEISVKKAPQNKSRGNRRGKGNRTAVLEVSQKQ